MNPLSITVYQGLASTTPFLTGRCLVLTTVVWAQINNLELGKMGSGLIVLSAVSQVERLAADPDGARLKFETPQVHRVGLKGLLNEHIVTCRSVQRLYCNHPSTPPIPPPVRTVRRPAERGRKRVRWCNLV